MSLSREESFRLSFRLADYIHWDSDGGPQARFRKREF